MGVQPLTPDRWRDLEALFGPRGACGGCWCMWWRMRPKGYKARKGEGNRRAFRALVAAGPPPGLLAYDGGRAVGWCAIGPRASLPRLDNSRNLAPVDDQPVWSISCLFVAKDAREQQVATRLVRAATDYALAAGATTVEAYPVDPPKRQVDAFVWTGLLSNYLCNGFREVKRRAPTRPIVRFEA